MIGFLRGRILDKQPPWLLLDVNGVGYEIEASMNTFYKLPEVGAELGLHTHFVVREDAQLLYGFADQQEKQLFRSLIKVNGVGPKMALGILSGISAEAFIRTVHNEDTTALVRVPGVGKKTAERLIVEMKDRLGLKSVPDEGKGRYHTLSGMMMWLLGRLPGTGDIAHWEGWRLEVVDLDGKRIDKVLASRLPDDAATAGRQSAEGAPSEDA